MPSRSDQDQAPRQERSKRQERAERILDVALELLLRWGYKKTTIDDIARQAGVAKGTIYLHWKTREDLFMALLLREWLLLIRDFRQYMADNPAAVSLSSFIKQTVYLATERPLLRAMMISDTEMLGDLMVRSTAGQNITQVRLALAKTYLGQLRDRGMLRTDIDVDTQIKMLAAIYMGYFLIDQFMPRDYHFSTTELAESLATTLHRTFEPEEPPSPEVARELAAIFNNQIDTFIDLIERKYRETDI